jgi:hypothetical protein
MPNVFISYAHSDVDEARPLVRKLKEQNVAGWFDSADIAAGESVASAVRNALKHSSVLIVLLSPRALHSEWVQFEIGAAEALDKKIIPIIISGDHLEEQLPDILRNRIWIDARHRSHEDVARDVNRAVESAQE